MRIQPLVQAWYHELLPVVAAAWNLDITETPVEFNNAGGLNATVSGELPRPVVGINEELLSLLKYSNSSIFTFGVSYFYDREIPLDFPQQFIDRSLQFILSANSPGELLPALEKRLRSPGHDEYKNRYRDSLFGVLEERQKSLLSLFGESEVTPDDLHPWISSVAAELSQVEIQCHLLECQVKFLFLHELAHVALGHTNDDEYTSDMEIEADLKAAQLYFCIFQDFDSEKVSVNRLAIFYLYLSIGFVEDFTQVVDRGIAYGIPSGLKEAYRHSLHQHPHIRERVRAMQKYYTPEITGISQLYGAIFEYGVLEIKRQFRLGVVDYRCFKWYCRIRGLEMQANFMIKAQPKAERLKMGQKVDIERGWDSIDFHAWGPLKDDLFTTQWNKLIWAGVE